MLESLFSQQVAQPYVTEKDFPPHKDAHTDRLFKHVTFLEDNESMNLRITAINHHGHKVHVSDAKQKMIETNLPITNIEDEAFRVKAMLSQEIHGISESFWVNQKRENSGDASNHNQFRIRGIANNQWKSDWVYSEIRDFENDLIIYNMLYDVLDLMMEIDDDQLEYLMDYIASDTYLSIMREMDPSFLTSLDFEEIKKSSLKDTYEILRQHASNKQEEEIISSFYEEFHALSSEMKKEFQENVMADPKEFADLYRVYQLTEQYQTLNKGFVQLLLEIFLEDRYEKIVQNTNIEVLVQNTEEMGVYLNSQYEFDIQNELVKSIYDVSPSERFVTNIDDAVQLIIDPIILEELIYGKTEEVEKVIRTAFRDLYAPMRAIDQHLLEIENELSDEDIFQGFGSIVEFNMIQDDYEVRHRLLFDVVENIIKKDIPMEDNYSIDFIDRMLNLLVNDQLHLLIDYAFDEIIEIIIGIGENVKTSYHELFFPNKETIDGRLIDHYELQTKKKKTSWKEAYTASLTDIQEILNKKSIQIWKESITSSIKEQLKADYLRFQKTINDSVYAVIKDQIKSNKLQENQSFYESSLLSFLDYIDHKDIYDVEITFEFITSWFQDHLETVDTTSQSMTKEMKISNFKDSYHNLFKHYLYHPNKFPLLETFHLTIDHDVMDKFILDPEEKVKYGLGLMEEGWPIGEFRLGVNTLKGEVDNS